MAVFSMNRRSLLCLVVVAACLGGCGTTKVPPPSSSQSTTAGVTAPIPDEKLTFLIAECARQQTLVVTQVGDTNVIESGEVYTPTPAAIESQLFVAPYAAPAYVVVLRGSFSELDASGRPHAEMWVLIPRSALIDNPQIGDGVCVFDDIQAGGWQTVPDLAAFGVSHALPTDVLTRKTPS